MSERRAVTKAIGTRYARLDRGAKKQVLDALCARTGWHRDHARKALRLALVLKPVRPRAPRPPLYGEPVIDALRFCWAVQGTPCGRLLAAALPDLVPRLRRFRELQIDDTTAAQLLRIAPATIDRRLKPDRARLDPRSRSHTKPGTLLKNSIPMRTWAEWDDAVPGFVEIDLVGHEGGNNRGEFCFTLDITDIAIILSTSFLLDGHGACLAIYLAAAAVFAISLTNVTAIKQGPLERLVTSTADDVRQGAAGTRLESASATSRWSQQSLKQAGCRKIGYRL